MRRMNDPIPAAPGWTPRTWREKPAAQQPPYDDADALQAICDRIRVLPPLVFSGEVETLKGEIAEAARGERFILHGGDCAERFADCNAAAIVRKLKILLQMSLVLTYGGRKPVARIGRIAGQYGKPRSKPVEVVDGVEMVPFRGDNVNSIEASPEARRPDPSRLLEAYFRSSSTLNFVRALIDGGFADLHHPEAWTIDYMRDAPQAAAYTEMADRIRDAIDYMESLGGLRGATQLLERVEFYTSHEGLILPYEEAHTRQPPPRPRHYNLGAHFLWIGDRTRQLDGAHVEYFRGIANPMGVKVGPTMQTDELARLLDVLDPHHEPGRITLITRFGAAKVRDHLPGLIEAVRATGRPVCWSCDPMHGNTTTVQGRKTRAFDDIVAELKAAFEVHAECGSHLGGVHFELTGDDVTECIGGAEGLRGEDLARAYETGCDPRLNYRQSLEIAFAIAHSLR